MRVLVPIKPNNKGYALLEILLAFSIAIIIITSMVALGASTVRALTTNRATFEAGKIAQREVDRLKLQRDTYPSVNGGYSSWENFYNNIKGCIVTAPCYLDRPDNYPSTVAFKFATGKSSTSVGNGTVAYSFYVDPSATDRIKYTVVTEWEVGPTDKTYKIEGVLTNWKEL